MPNKDAPVVLTFSKAFKLRLDDDTTIEFGAGAQPVPADLADHWYVKEHLAADPVEELPQIPLHPPSNADADALRAERDEMISKHEAEIADIKDAAAKAVLDAERAKADAESAVIEAGNAAASAKADAEALQVVANGHKAEADALRAELEALKAAKASDETAKKKG